MKGKRFLERKNKIHLIKEVKVTKFSSGNQMIIRSLLRKLPKQQKKAIILRFWEDQSIDEIAGTLKISWDDANELIENGLLLLKKEFIANTMCLKGKSPLVS